MALKGVKICFTGTLASKRSDMVTAATNKGANVINAVSAQCNILVAGPGAGSKLAKAAALGVTVWDEAKFLKAAGLGGGAMKVAAQAAMKAAPKSAAMKATAAKAMKATPRPPAAPKAKAKAKAKVAAGGRTLPGSTGKVIPASGLADKAKIVAPYDLDLNIADAAKNMDKFYRMQVVEAKVGAQCWFVLQYGRTGTTGQMQIKGPMSRDAAIKMMEAKFRQKTGKPWAQRGDAGSGSANSAARSGKGHYEMTARLTQAGAKFAKKKGAVAVSLMWDHSSKAMRNDLDLWVTAPSGERIGYSNQMSKCGGQLDVDRQEDAAKPVENIVWTTKAPKGTYTVKVHNYSSNHKRPMPFQVGIVLDGGEMEMIDKTMPAVRGSWVAVKKFKYL